jgi:hypothetical protein
MTGSAESGSSIELAMRGRKPMIYEVRTYRYKAGNLDEFHKRFAKSYAHRKQLSPVSGSFYAVIGALNLVINIWPYEDFAARVRIRDAAAKLEHWPPDVHEFLDYQKSEIFVPLPFAPQMESGQLGPIFELRSYLLRPGAMKGQVESWTESIDERRKVSPLVAAMRSECGELNRFVHIWGYRSLDHREEVRAEVAKRGIWPPRPLPPGDVLTQENMILRAAPYSPLQ